MRLVRLLSSLALLLGVRVWAGDAAFRTSEGKVEILLGGKPFSSFHYSDRWDKPFLHPLRSPSGVIVTRGYPVDPLPGEVQDHDWHRGLWWAHGDVGGVDFWREKGRDKTGRIVLRGEPRTHGDRLTAHTELIAPGGRRLASVVQEFTFRRSRDGNLVEVRIEIRGEPGMPLVLGDTEEGALGFRFADEFREDRGAILRNSDGLTGTKQIWGKRARWVDYSTTREARRIGVAILDHPSNPKHPTYWHARGYGLNAANAFGVRDFTRDKSQNGSITLPPGSSLAFRFRVVIHEGADPETLWQVFSKTK